MKEEFVVTVKAEVRPGLIQRVTGLIEKKQVEINSLNFALTDIRNIALITLQLRIVEHELLILANQLERIVEVLSVECGAYDESICLRAAYFKISNRLLEGPRANAFSKYDVSIIKLYGDAFLLAKSGTAHSIQKLFNELDGPDLLGFSQTGIITESKLIENDDESRLSRLAA